MWLQIPHLFHFFHHSLGMVDGYTCQRAWAVSGEGGGAVERRESNVTQTQLCIHYMYVPSYWRFPLYPQTFKQCLAHTQHSTNICSCLNSIAKKVDEQLEYIGPSVLTQIQSSNSIKKIELYFSQAWV